MLTWRGRELGPARQVLRCVSVVCVVLDRLVLSPRKPIPFRGMGITVAVPLAHLAIAVAFLAITSLLLLAGNKLRPLVPLAAS